MWISRKEWEAMEKKVSELEKRHLRHELDFVNCRNIWVRQKTEVYFSEPTEKPVSLKDVVEKLLDHFGLELTYVIGTSDRIDINKAPK